MSKKNKKIIQDLLHEVSASGREFSDVTLQFHELVAQKAGLAGADHKYLSIIMQHPSLTAGELAKIAGLTTGAVTGVIDRLEKQKLVSREKDATDRRKVVIVANSKMAQKLLGPIFQRLVSRLAIVNDGFSESELKVIIRYMNETNEAMKELIDELKA
jgi:DNA-binding MarR family transcriptional regulator